MAGLNKVMIIGNLGRDPEMRYTPSGSPVTNFSVAVTRKWNSRDGEARGRDGVVQRELLEQACRNSESVSDER